MTAPVSVNVAGDAGDLTVVAAALEQAADQRRRVALAASRELELERRDGKDIRTGAARVVRVLADADLLDSYAKAFAQAETKRTEPQPALPLEGGDGNGTGRLVTLDDGHVAWDPDAPAPPAPAAIDGDDPVDDTLPTAEDGDDVDEDADAAVL